MKTVGMDVIRMPVLDAAELYGINRAAERWGARSRAGPRQGGSKQETWTNLG